MMYNVVLETITPIHVGNGRFLAGNTEFLVFKNENKVAVIDEHKVLAILGNENIDQWVATIERGESLLDLLKRRRNLQASDVARRILTSPAGSPKASQQLKEQLHSGNGKPLIPGSSLKGAIRSALFGETMQKRSSVSVAELKGDKGRFSSSELVKKVFGPDPNQDILRHLHVSDFEFPETEVRLGITINQKRVAAKLGEGMSIKNEVSQYMEVIPAKSVAVGRIQIKDSLINLGKGKAGLFSSGIQLTSLNSLASRMNQHTITLLNQELKRWTEFPDTVEAQGYLEGIAQIRELVNEVQDQPGVCIMRTSFGSGWNFMTGGWVEQGIGANHFSSLTENLRYDKREPNKYKQMPFPKSRRIAETGVPFGFIKLTFVDGAKEALERVQQVAGLAIAARKEADLLASSRAEALRKAQEEEERRRRQPEYFTGTVKKGVIVDGIFSRIQDSKNKVFKLLIGEPGKEYEVVLRYPADLPQAESYLLEVQDIDKKSGKVITVNFKGAKGV